MDEIRKDTTKERRVLRGLCTMEDLDVIDRAAIRDLTPGLGRIAEA